MSTCLPWARAHHYGRDHSAPLSPFPDHFVLRKTGSSYQVFVNAGVTSYVFPVGHRIRLEVSMSNFPRFDRNLNTVEPVADALNAIKANQTVYHERKYPSALILPVISGAKSGLPEPPRHPTLHAARASL